MPLAHAILGFLDYGPMSGYDLKKIFDRSVTHFWSATQSHIYKALDGLEKEGWAKSKVILQEGRPNRKEYSITATGRSELQRWVTTPLPMAATREAWLIQLFFSHQSSNEEIVDLLMAREKEIRACLEALRGDNRVDEESVPEGAAPGSIAPKRMTRLWRMTAEYGIAYYEAELTWIHNAIMEAGQLPLLEAVNS